MMEPFGGGGVTAPALVSAEPRDEAGESGFTPKPRLLESPSCLAPSKLNARLCTRGGDHWLTRYYISSLILLT
jgi:hypothetical protein